MKKILLIILLLGSINYYLIPQNYQPFRSDRIACFETYEKLYKFARIDSIGITLGHDSIFYFMKNMERKEYCSIIGDSWLGEKVIHKHNGFDIFFNGDHDSIRINRDAGIGDKWLFYNLADSIIINATVLSINKEEFLGLSDNVKTIGLIPNEDLPEDLYNTLKKLNIKISENFGIIKTPNFYFFPDIRFGYHDNNSHLSSHLLAGLSNPVIGVQNLTKADIFDFEPGDELHVLEKSSTAIQGGSRTIRKQNNISFFRKARRTENNQICC
jgi:hypothetical protein